MKPKYFLTDVVGKGRCCKIGSMEDHGCDDGNDMRRLWYCTSAQAVQNCHPRIQVSQR